MEAAAVSAKARPRVRAARLGVGPSSPAVFKRDYWLAHCEGYRAHGADGRLGLVEEVRLGENGRDPVALVVRAWILGGRVLVVPVSDAAFIVPRAQRIWLNASAKGGRTGGRGRRRLSMLRASA